MAEREYIRGVRAVSEASDSANSAHVAHGEKPLSTRATTRFDGHVGRCPPQSDSYH